MAFNSEYSKIRVLVARADLDEEDDIGSKIVARVLSNAGMEVIYTGLRQTPDVLVDTAIQEDVDVININVRFESQVGLFTRISGLLKEKNAKEIALTASGTISAQDAAQLDKTGVMAVFPVGSSMQKMIDCIQTFYHTKHGV